MSTLLGQNATVQYLTKKVWTYFDGERQQLQFKGPAGLVEVVYNSFKQVAGHNPDYDSLDFDPGHGIGRLTVNKVEDGESVYELLPLEFSKPIQQADYFTKETPKLASDLAAWVLANYEDVNTYPTEASSTLNGKSLILWRLLRAGQTEYLESSAALRETKTVSKRSTLAASYVDVNKVVTPPDIKAINQLIGNLPEGEWLKKWPTVTRTGPRRWRIVQEWWWAQSWSIVYGGTFGSEIIT